MTKRGKGKKQSKKEEAERKKDEGERFFFDERVIARVVAGAIRREAEGEDECSD